MLRDISIALCIPTYKRANVVEEFLEKFSTAYTESGIDIYFYDSSEDEKTAEVISKYLSNGEIFYIKLPSTDKVDQKIIKIYQGFGLKKKYDFIWLSGDRRHFPKEGIQIIQKNLSFDIDFLAIDTEDRSGVIHKKTYTDCNEFFYDYACPLTLYGASLVSAHTMLQNVDWEYYEAECLTPEYTGFSHICFYFNRILELETFYGVSLSLGGYKKLGTNQSSISSWHNIFFETWCKYWVQVIEDLPEQYTRKNIVIKRMSQTLLGKRDSFVRLKIDGVYSLKIFLEFKSFWNKVTSIPPLSLFVISIIPAFLLKLFLKVRLKTKIFSLKKFCKKHNRICVLGSGSIGNMYGQVMNQQGICFEKFCSMPGKHIVNELQKHEVAAFEKMESELQEYAFVLALGPDETLKGQSLLHKRVAHKNIFSDSMLRRDIAFALGRQLFYI